MKRVTAFWLYAALLVILIAAVVVLVSVAVGRTNTALHERIGELETQITELSQPGIGGAEIAPPARMLQPSTNEITGYVFPILRGDYVMYTSEFGERISPILHVERFHEGLDISATTHARVGAIADGVVPSGRLPFDDVDIKGGHYPVPGTPVPGHPGVVYKGHKTYGGLVVIRHENGWYSLYAHLSSTNVHAGDVVHAGDMIGRIGRTGITTGDHLHLEIRTPDGEPVNPELYVSP